MDIALWQREEKMSRYIDADALDDTVLRLNNQGWGITNIDYKRMDRVLFEIPTADVRENVRGEWVEVDDALVKGYCSQCGWEAHYYEDDVVGMNFCPNCGADCRVESQEEKC